MDIGLTADHRLLIEYSPNIVLLLRQKHCDKPKIVKPFVITVRISNALSRRLADLKLRVKAYLFGIIQFRLMRPLDKLFVLDFSTLLPGPLATLMLAEMGAEVLKIEKPEVGDEMRGFQPRWGSDSVNFALLNRGKKSMTLDLKDPASIEILRPLIERADVLIEQFRPGVMDRLGLSYDAVKAIKPDIVYCSITGYGQTGPKSAEVGHDLNYLADTGLLSLSHGQPDHPVAPPALIADIAGGSYPALINILIALRARDQGMGGRHLDISMSDNLFPFLYWAIGNGTAIGQWPKNGGDLVTGGSPRYRLYKTSDDKLLAAAPLEDRFWALFCEAIALDSPLRESTADWATTRDCVARIIAGEPAAHWAAVFAKVDCCCCIVSTLEQALANPHFGRRGLFSHQVSSDHGATLSALPLPLDASFRDAPNAQSAPHLGADNEQFTSNDR